MTKLILLQTGAGGAFNPMILIMLAMFAVMYFFMIRPQQKKAKEQKTFTENLAKGQRIVTMGGIHGKIVQVNPDSNTVLIEVSDGVKLKVDQSVISMEYSQASYPAASES